MEAMQVPYFEQPFAIKVLLFLPHLSYEKWKYHKQNVEDI